MSVHITALYAIILTVILIGFAINVTRHRFKAGVSLGDGGDPAMARAVRIHGNAAEYIPIALLLMLIYELDGGSHLALHIGGIVLVVGRLLHARGMLRTRVPNNERAIGMCATWLAILAFAILNLLKIV
jgi:uncharacterized membrane protein YecN with MAPEG domain